METTLRPSEEPRRHRGGQPGNQNARKHGFYSKVLTVEEQQAMETADLLQGLAKEISLMRVKLRSLLYSPQSSPELVLQAVRTLSRMVDIQERINSG